MYYHLFVDNAGEWRWRLVAANGQSIACSGEGYKNRADCIYGIKLVKAANEAKVFEFAEVETEPKPRQRKPKPIPQQEGQPVPSETPYSEEPTEDFDPSIPMDQ